MTEEIKEILDDLGNKDNYIEEFGYQYKRISLYDSFQLLDYITNLQQENKAKTYQIEVLEEIVNYERNIRNDKLQQENEILRKNAEHNDKVVDKARWNEMIYKSRCEKAIEILEQDKASASFNTAERIALNILNGSDEK